jgi:hypothetical protein
MTKHEICRRCCNARRTRGGEYVYHGDDFVFIPRAWRWGKSDDNRWIDDGVFHCANNPDYWSTMPIDEVGENCPYVLELVVVESR